MITRLTRYYAFNLALEKINNFLLELYFAASLNFSQKLRLYFSYNIVKSHYKNIGVVVRIISNLKCKEF